MFYRTLTLLAALAMGISPLSAANDLGRSGPFRLIGGDGCGADFRAQRAGACDPAPIDPSKLSEAEATTARIDRAKRLLGLVRVEAAMAEIDTAIQAAPRHAGALHLRARMLISKYDLEAAHRDLIAAMAEPAADEAALRSSLAFAELQLGRIPDAIREADRAVALTPDDPDALWCRALARMAAGQRQQAEQDLDLAVRDPGNFRARLARAQLYLEDARFAAASADADKLIEARPSDFESRNIRAVARVGAGDMDGALEDLSSMIGPSGGPYLLPPRHPDFGRLTLQRAVLLVRAGQPETALKDIAYIISEGGIRSILQLQIYLRANGFPDVALDGQDTEKLKETTIMCFANLACGRGIARAI